MLPFSRSRRAGVLAASVASLGLLSGCSAGYDSTSRAPYAPGDGVIANSGSVRLLNVLIVAAEGADRGVVIGSVANRGDQDDRLVAIESPHGTVELGGGYDLAAKDMVPLSTGEDGGQVVISGLDREPGRAVPLRFVFESAEPVTVRTVIVPPNEYYEELTPSGDATTPSP